MNKWKCNFEALVFHGFGTLVLAFAPKTIILTTRLYNYNLLKLQLENVSTANKLWWAMNSPPSGRRGTTVDDFPPAYS